MNKLFIFSFIVLSIATQGQIGINTTHPQGVFHIDGLKDNATTPSETQQSNDFVVLKDGKTGIGITAPKASLHIKARNPTGNLATPEGVLIPKMDIARLNQMSTNADLQVGNLVYVDVTNTDVRNQYTNYVVFPGFYYWNGNYWSKMLTFDEKTGVDSNSLIYSSTAPDTSRTVECGRFVFRFNGTAARGYPEFKLLISPGANTASVKYGVQREVANNSNGTDYYTDQSRDFTASNYNVFTRLGNGDIRLGTNEEVAVAHMLYKGDANYYRVKFYKSNNVWSILCNRY